MLAYSDHAPSRRPAGANDVPSATEAKQEEAAAHTEGKEDDEAAEEARNRRRALHQALTSGPVSRRLSDPSRGVRASCAYLFPDENAQEDRAIRDRHPSRRDPHRGHPALATTFH